MMTHGEIEQANRERLASELGAAGEYSEDWETADINDLRERVHQLVATTKPLAGLALAESILASHGVPTAGECERALMAVRDARRAQDALVTQLAAAVKRVELANDEGDPIMSAWLPDARAALALARGEG